MKKLIIILVGSLTICASLHAQNGTRHPEVSTNEYVELMEIVARFADNTIFNENCAPAYQTDIEEYFADYKNHPAVTWMKNQLYKYCLGYDAIPWLGIHISMIDGNFMMIPGCDMSRSRWNDKAREEFLPLLSAFYKETDFHKFYEDHTETYDAAVDCFKENVGDYVDLDWFTEHFGKDNLDFKIIIGLNNGMGNFGIFRKLPGMKKEIFSIMMYATNADGSPKYRRSSNEDLILVHEFCHSFIKAPKSCKKVATRLMKENWEKMKAAYGTWRCVAEETFVRASVVRYMIDHGYSDEAIREEIKSQHEFYGFTWLPDDIDWYKGDVLTIFDNM